MEFHYNVDDYPELLEPLEPVPPGWYPVQIVDSNVGFNDLKQNKRITLTYQVLDGSYKDRKVTDGLNIENPNQQTVEIARKHLSTLCRTVGLSHVSDTYELHGRPLQIRVNVRAAEGEFAERNEVKEYRLIDGNDPKYNTVAAPASAPGSIAPAPAQPTQRPWKKDTAA
ncbi:MAG: DUF669 domain-containing protein [Gammaproteobacteria bacterium]